MLSREDNEILTSVGPGTPMGNLLRRYWTPACLSEELDEPGGAPLRVRLLGEDLVAFRSPSGDAGLIQESCPHRGASLYFGRNEECGLRCVYHGWAFDRHGRCVDMPSEPRPFAERISARAYPVHESGGIVWTYMGPDETMTPFRDFGTESLPEERIFASKLASSCNWVQTMEGNVDTAHISHLHQFFSIAEEPDDGTDEPGYPSHVTSWKSWWLDRRPRIEVNDEWYGFRYAGLRATPRGHTLARVTAYIFPYATIIAAMPFNTRELFVVPADDHNCYRYSFTAQVQDNPHGYGGPMVEGPYNRGFRSGVIEREYTSENEYQLDRDFQKVTFSGIRDFVSQDLMVTESMGPIYDRTQEHLGTTDLAIIRMRSQLINAAKDLTEGKEPTIGLSTEHDFRRIRAAEKILAEGEDWRVLGTDDDPVVKEALQGGWLA